MVLLGEMLMAGAEGGGGLGGLYPEQGFHMALKHPPQALPVQTFHRVVAALVGSQQPPPAERGHRAPGFQSHQPCSNAPIDCAR